MVLNIINTFVNMSSLSLGIFGLVGFGLTMACGYYFKIPVLSNFAHNTILFCVGLFKGFKSLFRHLNVTPKMDVQKKPHFENPVPPTQNGANLAPKQQNILTQGAPTPLANPYLMGRLNPWKPKQTQKNPVTGSNEFLSPEVQADNMFIDILPLLESGKKIALTYSANYEQYKGITAAYANGKYIIEGSNQAQVFNVLTKLIYQKNLQDQIHILPIVTMEFGGNHGTLTKEMVDDGLTNLAQHIHNDWVCLGLSGNHGFSIGGGINPNFKLGGEELGDYTHKVLNAFSKAKFPQGFTAADTIMQPPLQNPKQMPRQRA